MPCFAPARQRFEVLHVGHKRAAPRIILTELRQIRPDPLTNLKREVRCGGADHLLQLGVTWNGIQVLTNSHLPDCRRSPPGATA